MTLVTELLFNSFSIYEKYISAFDRLTFCFRVLHISIQYWFFDVLNSVNINLHFGKMQTIWCIEKP